MGGRGTAVGVWGSNYYFCVLLFERKEAEALGTPDLDPFSTGRERRVLTSILGKCGTWVRDVGGSFRVKRSKQVVVRGTVVGMWGVTAVCIRIELLPF